MNASNDDLSNRLRASLGSNDAPQLSADLVTGAAERPAPHLVNRGHRAVAAGGLTVALAAVVAGALVITAPHTQAPLFTAAGASGAAPEAMSSDSRLMVWNNYEYVPGEGLSTDTGEGHVYELQRAGSYESVLATMAEQFGVTGDPAKSQYFDEAYPTYVVGPEDGSAPSVVVTWSGTGDWWYNDSSAYPAYADCVVSPTDPNLCETPPPAENLAPDEAEARDIAQGIFAAGGLDVDTADIRVVADEWQTTASANLTVDGTATALEWTVGWGATGKISYAYGHSIDVVDKGSYGTVSAHDAVGRLADYRWYGTPGLDYQSGMNILAADMARTGEDPDAAVSSPTEPATDEPSAEPTSVPGDPGTTEPSEPSVDPTVEPTPVDPGVVDPMPMPTPETITVTVEEANETLLLMWDKDGNAWLVPGFAMPHPDGWWNAVVSLVDGVIALPDAIEPVDGVLY